MRAPGAGTPPGGGPTAALAGDDASGSGLAELHRRVIGWYASHARSLPWREPGTSPWGVLLSEVMSQQTPLSRVEPVWREWLRRWPTPADLAAAPAGEAVRAWGRLGYPRRALRLREAAGAIVSRHGGEVPADLSALRALPGVGPYTAAAVACFAFGLPAVVVDTNVRRVLARTLLGSAQAAPAAGRVEQALAQGALPGDAPTVAAWNVAAMELGALVCTSRTPCCGSCPVTDLCAWNRDGRPAYGGSPRRRQAWHGTDRQARGVLLAVMRAATEPVPVSDLERAWPPERQRARCLDSLVDDGLVERLPGERFRLPGVTGEPGSRAQNKLDPGA